MKWIVPRMALSLGGLNGTGPHQQDWDLRQVEVELRPAANEERAGEEFAALAVSHRDDERRDLFTQWNPRRL
jgi:hypothetical protein